MWDLVTLYTWSLLIIYSILVVCNLVNSSLYTIITIGWACLMLLLASVVRTYWLS